MTRPFSATKSAFLKLYPRPIHPLYRRVVEELLVELHLDTVNQAFSYDPFFALGVVTVTQTLLEGYPVPDQAPAIFTAMCRALQLKPEVLQEDAQKLTELLQADPHNGWLLLQRLPEAQDRHGLQEILNRIADPKYHYTRILLIGLFSAFQLVAPSGLGDPQERFISLMAESYGFAREQVKKDLSLFQSAQERLKQAKSVSEDIVKAARRQKEQRRNPAGTGS
ncbi:MAG: photosystem II biogenesis protein Psp29 [Thermostichales cyanobacterium SZTDM-1c_bins_54]